MQKKESQDNFQDDGSNDSQQQFHTTVIAPSQTKSESQKREDQFFQHNQEEGFEQAALSNISVKEIQADNKASFQVIPSQTIEIGGDRLEIEKSHSTISLKTTSNNHQQCQHECSCSLKALKAASRGFFIGYGVKTAIGLLTLLLRSGKRLAQKPSLFAVAFFDLTALSFGAFLGSYNLILQATTCLFRVLLREKGQKARTFLSGALAGFFSMKFYRINKYSRSLWALFLLSRAFECFYNSLIERGLVPRFKQDWSVIFSIMWSFIAYSTSFEPCNLPSAQVKFGNSFGCEDIADCNVRRAWILKKNRELLDTYDKNFPLCNPATYIPPPKAQIKLFKEGI